MYHYTFQTTGEHFVVSRSLTTFSGYIIAIKLKQSHDQPGCAHAIAVVN